MTTLIAYSLFGYFEALYDLNRNIITLCGLDVADTLNRYEKTLANTIAAIPRLVPYVYNKKAQCYTIDKKDGLMEFSDSIPFLKDEYEALLSNHISFLSSIKAVRNKFEHKMHGAQITAGHCVGGKVDFGIAYTIDGEEIELKSSELISFVKDINALFSKIQSEMKKCAQELCEINRQNYQRLMRFDFLDFNRIFESKELFYFGKSMYPF